MTSSAKFKHIQVNDIEKKLPENHYVIIDIRDANAFASGHIPGAVHVTNENIGDFLRDADFDAPTVVCCYHGISSQPAADYLISQDFSDVYSLDGGFVQWQALYPEIVER